jgi:hypothetical protein
MLVEQLADKVNARADTPAERLAAVENFPPGYHFGLGRHGDAHRH